jgi:phosphoglycerate kinase
MIQQIEKLDMQAGSRVFVRVDFNVPLDEQQNITDDTRMQAALPTLQYLAQKGAKIVLASHLGRPKSKSDIQYSLKPLANHLAKISGISVQFVADCVGEEVETALAQAQNGTIVLLENLRFYPEEEKGDATFAKTLTKNIDFYVHDAFGTAHRAHASTAVMAQYFDAQHKAFGFLMQKEVESLEKVLRHAQKPFVAIVGGAKVSSKITLLEELLPKVDTLIIGGGMAYTFFKAQGGEVGKSLVEADYLPLAQKILQKAKDLGVKVLLPADSLVADAFANDAITMHSNSLEIPADYMGLDIAEKAIATYTQAILQAKTILWNGPMGVFEMPSFAKGTLAIAQAVVEATQKHGAYSLVGGGDSVAALQQFHLTDKVSYVSTGGGAMLEYLEKGTLPGVQAILA